MWLSEKLAAQRREEIPAAEAGTVTIDESGAAVYAHGEIRGGTVLAPGGVAWRPRNGAQALVLKGAASEEKNYILGVENEELAELEPGEVCLYTSGGAKVHLTRDGKILLWGTVYVNGLPLLG